MQPTIGGYFTLLLGPFFRWWWSVITGVATVVGFTVTPPAGIWLSRIGVVILVLSLSALFFLTFSALSQGWEIYASRAERIQILGVQKCSDYGGELVILLRGSLPTAHRTLLEIKRPMGDSEVLFALVEVMDRTAKGDHQARPIHLTPGHLKDLRDGKFQTSDLVAYLHVDGETIRKTLDCFRPTGI